MNTNNINNLRPRLKKLNTLPVKPPNFDKLFKPKLYPKKLSSLSDNFVLDELDEDDNNEEGEYFNRKLITPKNSSRLRLSFNKCQNYNIYKEIYVCSEESKSDDDSSLNESISNEMEELKNENEFYEKEYEKVEDLSDIFLYRKKMISMKNKFKHIHPYEELTEKSKLLTQYLSEGKPKISHLPRKTTTILGYNLKKKLKPTTHQ